MIGKPSAEVEQELRVAMALNKYAIAMTVWRQRQKNADAVYPAALTKAAQVFREIILEHDRADDIPFQRAFQYAIKEAHLPQVLDCVNDTDHDGGCHLCVGNGGCIVRGGPFL